MRCMSTSTNTTRPPHFLSSSPMAAMSDSVKVVFFFLAAVLLITSSSHGGVADALSTRYYAKTCPNVESIVQSAMAQAVAAEPRMGASILRLHFHDCFVNGCDASLLLDSAAGEKGAGANAGSARGFEVVDAIKSRLEASCPRAVSCADALALAARDAVSLLGGPTWQVRLGRKDSRAASSLAAANANLPAPGSSLATLAASFAAKGLSARDMTALSGAHTVGRARCETFRGRIVNGGDANVNATFAARLRRACAAGGDAAVAPLDGETPDAFDNGYFRELTRRRGLLHSDQELFAGGKSAQDALVRKYAGDAGEFARDFAKAMVKMGNLAPAARTPLEIRLNCRKPN